LIKESKIEINVTCGCGSQDMKTSPYVGSVGNYMIIDCLKCNKSIMIFPQILKESDKV